MQDLKRPDGQAKVQAIYGSSDPRSLWNASFAASPPNWVLGSAGTMCEALAPKQVRSIAIVGNAPLTAAQRALIGTKDRVLRFNALNNM